MREVLYRRNHVYIVLKKNFFSCMFSTSDLLYFDMEYASTVQFWFCCDS
jgi:hypothetical protein